MPNLGTAQQRLGRDTAPIEADAAEMLAFDECGFEPELGGADRRDIAARPAAQNHQIEPSFGHRRGPAYSSMVSGSSTRSLNAFRNLAPVAPSTTRWSQASVQLMTVATPSAPFLTTGRASPAPIA